MVKIQNYEFKMMNGSSITRRWLSSAGCRWPRSAHQGPRASLFRALLLLIISQLIIHKSAFPQQPQAQAGQQIYPVNAKYVNGVAPGYWPTAGSGLSLNLSAGTAVCNNATKTYAGGTLTLAAGTTNYVYLDPTNNCAPASNTTGFNTGSIPIAAVVTGSSAISSVTDVRTMFNSSPVLGNNATVLDATQFGGADFGMQLGNALAQIYSLGGGTVDARGFNCVSASCVIGTQNLTIGDGTHPVIVYLPAGTITRGTLSTGYSAQVLYNSNVTIIAPKTTLSGPSDVTAFQQAYNGSGVSGVKVDGLQVTDTGTVHSGSVAFMIGGPNNAGIAQGNEPNVVYTGTINGGNSPGYPGFWPGCAAHYALYNKVLTPTQIVHHYSVGSTTGSSYESTVEADAPIAYWPMTETSGTVAHDVMSNHWNGTYTGGVTLGSQAGIPGAAGTTCPSFDGSTGYIALPSESYFPSGDFTLEAWVYPTTAPGPLKLYWGFGTQWVNSVDVQEWTSSSGGTMFLVFNDGTLYNNTQSQIAAPQNTFTYIVWTHSASGQSSWTYVNGAQTRVGTDVLSSVFTNVGAGGADIGLQMNSQHGCVCYNQLHNPSVGGASIGLQTVNNSGYGFGVNQNQIFGGHFGGPIGIQDAGGTINTFYSPDLENNSTNYMQLLGSATTVFSPYEEAGGGDYLCGGYNTVLGALGTENGAAYSPTYCSQSSSVYGGPATDFVSGPHASPQTLGVRNYISFGTTAQTDIGSDGSVRLYSGGPQWNEWQNYGYGQWGSAPWQVGRLSAMDGINSQGPVNLSPIANPAAPTASVVGTAGSNSAKYGLVGSDYSGTTKTMASSWSNTLTNVPSTLSSSNEVCLTWAAVDGIWTWDVIKDDITHSEVGSIATGIKPSIPVGGNTITFCDTGQSVNTSYAMPSRNSTGDFYFGSGNIYLGPTPYSVTQMYFGTGNLWLDSLYPGSGPGQMILGYNTGKGTYNGFSLQIFNNSTDRNQIFWVHGAGTASGQTNSVGTLHNTLDDGSGNMTAAGNVTGQQFCLSSSCLNSWASLANQALSNLTSPTAINLSTLTFSGAAGITAGGSNQPVTISASGTGTVTVAGGSIVLGNATLPSPVGWWKLNEGSGSTATDSSGNGNNGSWSGTQAGSSGYYDTSCPQLSYCGHFDGSTDYVNMGNVDNMGTSNYTVSAWVKTTNTSSFMNIVGKTEMGGQLGRWYLASNDSDCGSLPNFCAMFAYQASGANLYAGVSGYHDGNWHLLTVTFNRSGNMTFYADGNYQSATSISAYSSVNMTTSDVLLIGAYGNSVGGVPPGDFLADDVSDVRIYNAALNSAQVMAIYSGAAPTVFTSNNTLDDGNGNLTAVGNVTAGNGSNVVYRCTTAGTLPVGALTIAAGNCGASTDTGLRVK